MYQDITQSKSSCSFFFTPVYDSIKEIDSNEKTKDKSKFYLVQTPQISKLGDLKDSLQKCIDDDVDCPDESFAIEYSNLKLSRIKGSRSNIKKKGQKGSGNNSTSSQSQLPPIIEVKQGDSNWKNFGWSDKDAFSLIKHEAQYDIYINMDWDRDIVGVGVGVG